MIILLMFFQLMINYLFYLMDSKKEELIKSKKISTEDLIRTDLAKEPEQKPKKAGFIARKSKRIKKAFGEFYRPL